MDKYFNKITYLILFLLLFPSLTLASTFLFQADLKKGDKSLDIIELQKILNMATDTRVTFSGLGSYGNETDYFGGLTQASVIRFQNKYKNEILDPVGLTVGNGFVGWFTRNKLNSLIGVLKNNTTPKSSSGESNVSVKATSSSDNSTISTSDQKMPPFIDYLSDINVAPGGLLTIYGSGFSSSDSVYFGNDKVQNPKIDSKNGTISCVVSVGKGIYLVSVKNNIGESKFVTPIFFVVSDTVLVKSKQTKSDASNGKDVEYVLSLMGNQ